MEYPDYKTYELLYAKYLNGHRTEQMIRWAIEKIEGNLAEKTFLDICCGSGRGTRKALDLGFGNAIMVDKEPKMIPSEFKTKESVEVVAGLDVSLFLEIYNVDDNKREFIDVAFCQQGANYWLNDVTANLLWQRMKPNGVFVFNTFHKKPPAMNQPSMKKYKIDDNEYIEISWYEAWSNSVKHFQIMNGEQIHSTIFEWLSEDYLKRNVLTDIFDFDIINSGNTDIYRCVKKG